MKTFSIILLLAFSLAGFADSAKKNLPAYEIEVAYLKIADLIASENYKNGPCGPNLDAYTENVVNAARKSREYFDLNYSWNKATNRPFELTPVVNRVLKTTLALKEIYQKLGDDAPSYEKALNKVIMWGPAPGAYGNITKITFGRNNSILFSKLEEVDGDIEWIDFGGSFEVTKVGSQFLITLEYNGQLESYFLKQEAISGMWVMIPKGKPWANPYQEGFVDYPSECDA